jgi:tRNA/rRNA methyltransferase
MNILGNIVIVLVGSLYPGNIGSVARAMNNMGLSRLTLVNPQCRVDEQSYGMATHAKKILLNLNVVTTVKEAIAGSGYVFGTTARSRRWRNLVNPQEMAQHAMSVLQTNKIAILFGPEDAGLTNEELELCNEVVTIPTARGAKSMNVSHAVLVICYEIYCAAQKPLASKPIEFAPTKQVEDMYDHMESALLKIGFLNPQNPGHFMSRFRRIFTRAGLTRTDVSYIRGIFRQLLWYIKKQEKTGQT